MTGRLRIVLVSALLLSSAACEARQDSEAEAYRAELYDGCAQCHGEAGQGNQDIGAPSIAGLERWYVKAQLRKFKRSHRGWHSEDMGGKKMWPMAQAMDTDEKVDLVSTYVASLPASKPAPTLEGGNPETGKIYFATCVQCHGADAGGNIDEYGPPLNHASDWYLLTQLQNFKEGRRGTHPGDVTGAKMRPFSMTLPNEQAMKDVIAYIGTLQNQEDTKVD
ncbi:MAG: c-type cytochrome [Polyangiales bacterium]